MSISINEFVVMVSTINGSGSQSANLIMMRAISNMGVPVSGKNLFPSNIAGLPTWFWIRASEKGFLGKAEKCQIMISMNPATLNDDLSKLNEGGYFIHNSDGFNVSPDLRPDVHRIPIPCKAIVEGTTESLKARKYLYNVAYVGVLSALLGIEEEACVNAVRDQLGNKGAMVESNVKALLNGREFAKNLSGPLSFSYKIERRKLTDQHIFIDGNSAAALGLVMGGFQVAAWYPITPSTSVIEGLEKYARELRKDENGKNTYAIVQVEDELAAVSMILGAGWAGARSVTATSGPGISLMQETAGLTYYSDIPCVVWNVQRTGPSTGLPTRTMQGDILSCVYASHGDTLFPILMPCDMQECYEFGQISLDLAERLQQMIFVLTDLDLGMNVWLTPKFPYLDQPMDRGKIIHSKELDAMARFERFGDPDGDGISYRNLPWEGNAKTAFLTRGSGHNAQALYSESPKEYVEQVDRLKRKWETAKTIVPKPYVDSQKNAVGLLAFGSTDLCMKETREILKQSGIANDYIRLKALPFTQEVDEFMKSHDRVYIVEQNRDGQMLKLLQTEIPQYANKYYSIRYYESIPISADFIGREIIKLEKGGL